MKLTPEQREEIAFAAAHYLSPDSIQKFFMRVETVLPVFEFGYWQIIPSGNSVSIEFVSYADGILTEVAATPTSTSVAIVPIRQIQSVELKESIETTEVNIHTASMGAPTLFYRAANPLLAEKLQAFAVSVIAAVRQAEGRRMSNVG
jgi:hypothetical protein